ncbi:MAG: virulence protein RhuM/Fic/DOC family protein [Deltaproteobacteria bacterium]|nr:virulence protein RhuM/Fic/DOC family protein [Deltaproteobacteria bacterium]
MINDKQKTGEIIIYQAQDKEHRIEVRLVDDTVWLSQKHMAELFDKDSDTVGLHLKNIYTEGELNERSTTEFLSVVQKEGNRNVKRNIKFYNLDAIISVGYRVNSKRGTQFRIWATRTLKDHLIKGYTINEKRLLETKDKLRNLQETISFLQEKSKHELLSGQGQEILNLLANYSKTLTLLEQYDKEKLSASKKGRAKFALDIDDCKGIIENLKQNLIVKKEAGELFGKENSGRFEGIIKGLYQTFGGKEIYKSIEEKAAHLLYLIIKDHPFLDGNKRIASILFVYFLERNNYLYKKSGERKINDNALAALALLIAISDPKEKETMINIITNLIG